MAAKRRRKRGSSWRFHLLGLLGLGCVLWSAVGLLTRVPEAGPPTAPPPEAPQRPLSYYPLEVGRYWVYAHADPHSGARVQTERRIERRERRTGQELFFFSDSSVVYFQDGRVYEIGARGGVNVIPMDSAAAPYVYQSQGLHIEKRLGAMDTVVEVQGRRYEDCLEVITRLRSERGTEMAYASYYARGIGLVGQEPLPRREHGGLSVVLQDYGSQQL